jgi:hypothetical protein
MKRPRVVVSETVGEFVREAAVLVAVFGLLDKVVKGEELTLAWAVAVAGCAIVLLVAGMLCKLLEGP